jgi:pimeloyl-ACP methyl ester carboxylesterase
MQEPRKTDYFIENDQGQHIYVRRVHSEGMTPRQSLVLLHGARVSGVPSFDLNVPGGSLAADMAGLGFDVHIMDARGYGGSWRPPEMQQPRDDNPSLGRSDEIVQDICAAVDHLRGEGRKVALLGWATGAHWAGQYASVLSRKLSHLILYNGLYGAAEGHSSLGRGSGLEDPEKPGSFNHAAFGAHWDSTVESLLTAWNNSIPIDDKNVWRSPEVAEAYGRLALESDPDSQTRSPPAFRAPTGAMEDSFYIALGRQFWDASTIRCPALVIRATNDFWSRAEDADKMMEHLTMAERREKLIIQGGTHFVHLDRPERGRDELISGVTAFLKA